MASKIQVILGRDVPNLGHIGDLVNVAPGYLRNFLMPKKMALPVSKSRIREFEHQKKIIQHRLAKLRAVSEDLRDQVEAQKLVFEVKTHEKGKIFGSIGARDVEAKLKELGFDIYHKDIKLEDGPIKSIGLHEIPVRLEGGVMAKVKIVLVAQEIVEEESKQDKEEDGYEALDNKAAVSSNDDEAGQESSDEESEQ